MTGQGGAGAVAGEETGARQQGAAGRLVGEWFWRFLAAVMIVAVGWVAWIAYQLNPPPLATQAAWEAAARARASRTASGVIGTRPGAEEARTAAEAPQPPASPLAAKPASGEPPVNVERLRFSDTISTPLAQEPDRK
jgi:endonuclease YncB( thermonuclease family)